MASRYYFPASSAASETTAVDAGWNYNSEVSRHNLAATKGSSAIGAGTLIGALSGTAGHKGIDRQWFSPALAAQTISGTVSLMVMTREGAGTDNVDRCWLGIFVVNSSGTKVATLLTLGNATGAATTEWVANATHRTCTFANAANLTSYACAAGDKIVVEIGGGNSASGTSPEFSFKWGENATDATLGDNATTTDRAGWVEFSANLTPNPVPVTGALAGVSTSAGAIVALLGSLAALSGASTSTGTVDADLGVLGSLVGASTSVGSITGIVEEDSAVAVEGALSGTSASVGTLSGLVGVVGTCAGASSSAGSLVACTGVIGAADGASTSAGSLVAAAGLIGTIAGASTSSGSLAGLVEQYEGPAEGEGQAAPVVALRLGIGIGL